MYGCGLRVKELVCLRVKDVDFQLSSITIKSGKGDKDRVTVFPESLKDGVQEQLEKVRPLTEKDCMDDIAGVYLPHALEVTAKNKGKEWPWFWLFPSQELSVDPRSGVLRRHHISPTTIQRQAKRRSQEQVLIKMHRFILCDTALRPIWWKRDMISGQFRNCSGMLMSEQP